MQEEGRKMSQLCSEVSTEIFYKRLNIIHTIAKFWSERQDDVLIDLFDGLLTSNDAQLLESDVIITADSTDDVGTETATSKFQCNVKDKLTEDSPDDLIPMINCNELPTESNTHNKIENSDREEVEASSGDAVASEMVDVGMTVEINPDNGILCDQTGSPINLTTLINIPTEST